MSDNELTNRNIQSNGSLIEGDASVKNGDFVGRDKIIGFSAEEVSQLLEILSKHFSTQYLKSPDQLDAVLSNFQQLHEELYEWKELHNLLDRILQAYEQFAAQILNAHTPIEIREVCNLWFPVNLCILDLLTFSSKIRYIGHQYITIDGGEIQGEIWAIDFENMRRDFDTNLTRQSNLSQGISRKKIFHFLRNLSYSLGIDTNSWNELIDLTRKFRHIILQYMHFTDKKLRDTASRLYHASRDSLTR